MKSYIIYWIITIASLLSTGLISCTTTKEVEVPVYVEKIKTEYINQLYKDSVYVHDSIDRYISGDTVYLYKYKYIYKYLNNTDTIYKTEYKEKPIPVKEVEIKEVNKIKLYQSVLMWLGGLFTIITSFKLGKFIKGKI